MIQLRLFLLLWLFPLLLFSQEEYKKVSAKSGDGIHVLLNRYSLDTPELYKAFVELNKDKLGKKNYLVEGRYYLLPKSNYKKIKSFEIFGEDYKDVEIIDDILKGAIYYIVAGHGGPDPGAQGKRNGHTLSEDEYAYDISLRLARDLISHGAIAYMITRDENDGIRDDVYLPNDRDETIWKNKTIPRSANKKLRQRARVVNKLYKENKGRYQRMIVVHIDSRYEKQRVDIYGYYSSKSKKGKDFTWNLINTVEKKYAKVQPGRGFSGVAKSRDKLYMIKYTDPVTAFLELGNIQNKADQVRFTKYENRAAIAQWLTQGCIIDYKNR
ncbi:MAG: N-acetylmuramoyl-L-alanine amidase [Bacteroidetes bacterium 4572_77]|nr:MAG: N-acetylmuramoyl-L-alanine amidase [Bacteroidetes bacterium 4572_77]